MVCWAVQFGIVRPVNDIDRLIATAVAGVLGVVLLYLIAGLRRLSHAWSVALSLLAPLFGIGCVVAAVATKRSGFAAHVVWVAWGAVAVFFLLLGVSEWGVRLRARKRKDRDDE